MTRLNASASEVMLKYDANACTDVTGYGLLGHGLEMAEGNDVGLRIDSSAVPYFADAPALVRKKTYTQAYLANTSFLAEKVTFHPAGFGGDATYFDGGGNVGRSVICSAGGER